MLSYIGWQLLCQNNEEFNNAADTENAGWQNNEEFNTATDTENAGWQNDEEFNTVAVDNDNAGWQNEENVENQDGFTTADGDENAWQAEEVNDYGNIDCRYYYSSDIVRRPQRIRISHTFFRKLPTSVKTKWGFFSNFCGLLRMS